MFAYVLNLAYLVLLAMASPWLFYQSLRTGKHRQGWREKFLGLVAKCDSERPCLWVHAVSVGEIMLIRSLVAEFQRRHADWRIVISTTTQSGFAVARSRYPECGVFYCPLDFSWAVRRAMRRVRPTLLILAELELWPNLIRAAREHGARVAIVNGRLSDRSFRGYARFRWFIARLLQGIDLIAAQDQATVERFIQLGAAAEKVRCTGSLKYDGAQLDRQNPATLRLRRMAGLNDSDPVWLAGSTQAGEEAIVIAAYRQLHAEFPRLRLIVVPRHPERFVEVAQLLDDSGLVWKRRSDWRDEPTYEPTSPNDAPLVAPPWQALLIDRVGELGAWWGAARIAFVGGSLGSRGGQNMIEPAAYGAAVCFGPNTRNFRDIVRALVAADAARVVHDGQELANFVRQCLNDPAFCRRLGESARRVVIENQGATSRTAALLDGLMLTANSAAENGAPSRDARGRAA